MLDSITAITAAIIVVVAPVTCKTPLLSHPP
jgi:hypothetical protein